jgi:nitrate reductase assembly molybdenum cofactor insertion protein NarJ
MARSENNWKFTQMAINELIRKLSSCMSDYSFPYEAVVRLLCDITSIPDDGANREL